MNIDLEKELYNTTSVSHNDIKNPDVAHLTVHGNTVIGSHTLPGLNIKAEQIDGKVVVSLHLEKDIVIEKPVHMCFGLLPEKGIQHIVMDVQTDENSQISIVAHCSFPNAVEIVHKMDADIRIGKNSEYKYFERHVHGNTGGIKVIPRAKVQLEEGARFKTEFELLKGRVGEIDIEYETSCEKNSILEMDARINGIEDDIIKINEIGHLNGEKSRGVLNSRIAVRDNAVANIYNKMTASAPGARGHVDCKEIVQDNGRASAIPIVEVNNPKAHVTHEAAIGSVDSKQLDTLMSRGLDEDEAVELIIQGLLS